LTILLAAWSDGDRSAFEKLRLHLTTSRNQIYIPSTFQED